MLYPVCILFVGISEMVVMLRGMCWSVFCVFYIMMVMSGVGEYVSWVA